jgi:chromobox protein 1
MDVLKAYWDKIGGKPQAKPKTPAKKGTKRKSLAQHTPEPDASSTTKKRGRKSIKTADEPADDKTPALPEGSWEDHVELVEAVEKPDHGEFKGGLMFFLRWQDGHKTQHTAQLCRQKCPQKVIYSYPQPPYHLLTRHSFSTTTSPNCTAALPNPTDEDVTLTRPRVFKTSDDE